MSETEIKKDHISRLHYLSYFTGIKYECIEYGTPGRWGDYIHKKNVKPTSVKLWYIKNEVFKYFDRFDELDRYCLIKLCLINGITDPNNYIPEVRPDYYSDTVSFSYGKKDELLEELNTYLEKSSNMSDYEKVMYILNKEYGYVLTSLQNKHNAEIISINISDIVQLNEEYYVKVNNHNKVNDLYKELYSNDDKMDFQKFPVCVLLKEGDKYRVIDGYHRLFVARTSDYGEIIKVIVIY